MPSKPQAVSVMWPASRKGKNTKLLSIEMEYLISMGCEETCPAVSAKRIVDWEIPDPKGKSIDVFREFRDIIEHKVKALLEGIEKDI